MSEIIQPTFVKDKSMIDLGGVARVTVHRTNGATLFAVHGALIKVSPGGMLLCLDSCIPYDKTVSIHVVFDDEDGEVDGALVLDGKVVWTRPGEDGKWVTSCECGEDLPETMFAMFAQRGQADHRREARRPTRLVAMARWQQSSDEQPIDIIDVSQRGFALRASKIGAAGDPVSIRFKSIDGDEVTVAANLQWKVRTGAGYLGGCRLERKTDVRHLAPFIVDVSADVLSDERGQRTERHTGPRVSAPSSTAKKSTRVRVSFALVAALLLIFVGPPLVVLRVLHADRATPALRDSDNEVFELAAPQSGGPGSAAAELAAPVRPTDAHVDEPGVAANADSPRSDDHVNRDHKQLKDDRATVEADSPHDVAESEPITSDVGLDVAAAPAVSSQLGTAAFKRGRVALASHQTDIAATAFAEAAEADPDVALHHYHWAMALHMDGQSAAAVDRVCEAVRIERMHGLANWGEVMSRIQGRPRLWLERARREALCAE